MELLRNLEDRGYPLEYLLARIRGRRSYLIDDWGPALAAAEPLAAASLAPWRQASGLTREEAVWNSLLGELAWVYSQMERRTRAIFAPVFLYFELRTVILCLRRRTAGDEGDLAALFRFSLLSAELKRFLQEHHDTDAIVAGLAKFFSTMAKPVKGLRKAYREGGLAGLEEWLTNSCLEHTANTRLHPIIAEFFSRLIDMKNIIILAKHLRWRNAITPSFIAGGKIRESHLLEAAGGQEMAGAALLRRIAGSEAGLTAGNLESLLLTAITRVVRRAGRETEGIGLILDYLWRCSMQARNFSLLVHGTEIDRGVLGGELIT